MNQEQQKQIFNILKTSKYKSDIPKTIDLIRFLISKGAILYIHGLSMVLSISVEKFEENKKVLISLNHFDKFIYRLKKQEYIILLYISSNFQDTKIVAKKFINEQNPQRVHFFNDKHRQIRTWERKYIDFFANLNDPSI